MVTLSSPELQSQRTGPSEKRSPREHEHVVLDNGTPDVA
jgi:hypothetical protein